MFMFLPNPTAPAQTNSRPIKSAPGHLVAVHAWRSRLSARSILVAWLDWNLDLNLTDALARASGVDVAGEAKDNAIGMQHKRNERHVQHQRVAGGGRTYYVRTGCRSPELLHRRRTALVCEILN
ncbi:hypothetical protein BRADI_3g38592v3 [Brachypodium distachyon]|uniref:Uncharacterized protein n=1 Tax=Brachypodium distachyon TaxID=15368 RepID=A0A0Q3FKL6_BRADI|nr:hypothetical protein BRADI_3g38592v3 [Brachypodium distachyon]